jgi:hypothetical protein
MNSVPVKAVNLSKEMGIDVLYDNYEYKIVRSYLMGADPIDKQINTYIQNGWKLYGELIKSGDTFFQAMIRKLPAKGGNRTRRNR